jgi:hypothetical protein
MRDRGKMSPYAGSEGQDGRVDLDVFVSLVGERQSNWERHGIKVKFGRSDEQGSASVTYGRLAKVGQLTVWSNESADLGIARMGFPEDDPVWHLYGLLAENELAGSLDDQTEQLLTDD